MSYSVRFSSVAQGQLAALEDYIAESGSPITAARYVDAIVTYCTSLAMFPLRGQRRDDLMPGLRITHYRGRTAIGFLVDEEHGTVSIIGVFYGGRHYEALLQGELDDSDGAH